MKIHLEADYVSQAIYSPIYRFDGTLTAVTLSTPFTHVSANVVVPQEIINAQLSPEMRVTLLMSQLNELETQQSFFYEHQIQASISVDRVLVEAIVSHDLLQRRLQALRFIELDIKENYPHLSDGIDHPQLSALSERFTLCLENFGAGKASPKAVYDGLFTRVKLDKLFIQHAMKRLSFLPFINAIYDNVSPHCHDMVIQGIDNRTQLDKVRMLPFQGVAGDIFPHATRDSLSQLITPPDVLLSLG